jgi:hypothetical protein
MWYQIDWNAVAALGTAVAVIVALWQGLAGKAQVTRQLRHQNDLERRRIEEEYLRRVLDVLHDPLHSAQNFFFEAARVLSAIPANIAVDAAAIAPLQAVMARTIEETKDFDKIAGNYIDILGAFAERYEREGRVAEATALRRIMTSITGVIDRTGDLREWLANEETIRSQSPEDFGALSIVQNAREASDAASKEIARRLASIYGE